MNIPTVVSVCLAASVLASSTRAQTSFPEIEPNSLKSEATLVTGMVAGDSVTGTTTGGNVFGGDSSLTSSDTFRIKTAAAPLGIYKHTLTLTGSGSNDENLLGVAQSAGVIQNFESVFTYSFSSITGNTISWYGFGKQEEVYYRVNGSSGSGTPYVATLSTTLVTPVSVAGAFMPGNVTVTTVGQGHSSDTEIYVYDANLTPIALGHNDGLSLSDPTVSTVVLNLGPGTYYAAVSQFNTANNQSDLNPTEFWDNDALLDFPDVMANNDGFGPVDVTYTVTDGTTSTQVPSQVSDFGIAWGIFTIGTPAQTFCSGDGSGTACPCGNSGIAGNGCASSVSSVGAHLAASGVPSIGGDTFVLSGSGMPNSSALYFQGTSQLVAGNGVVFGDGLRCAGGSITRLGTKTNASGASAYPTSGNTPISIRGANSAGAVRDYQVWYRNAAAFCTASTFNLTNGVEVTWAP